MEEDLIEAQLKLAGNDEFGLVPGKLLVQEVHFLNGFRLEHTRYLYNLCVNLALHYENYPQGVSRGNFDYIQGKVRKNFFYKEAYGGFEPYEFCEISKAKFNPVAITEKEMNSELEVFSKKTNKGHKKQKPAIKFNAKKVVFPESETPLSEEEKRVWIERERKIFEETVYSSRADVGMYDVYYGYSNVEVKTKNEYNFFKDGYEFNEFKLCFAFKLRQIEKDSVRPFFKYQLKENFQSDKEQFNDFVKGIIDGYNDSDFFPVHLIKPVNDFLGEHYMNKVTDTEKLEKNEDISKDIEPLEKPTHKQIVKAIEFMLLNLKDFEFNENNFDLSNLLRFFHFITETSIPEKIKASQSHFYKVWRERHKASKEQQLKDLNVILAFFMSLKMDSAPVVLNIKKEIERIQIK